ncbi:hypothetical protein NEAUS03_0242 [Nematocida ausubeli]|nr:hypothetical protein NEAUS03_0242 [Nematocida ausubeli]
MEKTNMFLCTHPEHEKDIKNKFRYSILIILIRCVLNKEYGQHDKEYHHKNTVLTARLFTLLFSELTKGLIHLRIRVYKSKEKPKKLYIVIKEYPKEEYKKLNNFSNTSITEALMP